MAFFHESSCECTKTELDLFAVPPTQTSIETGVFCDYHPLTSIGDGGPIEFEVSGTGENYIDLSNTYLYIKAKVIKLDGTNIADDAAVGPTNNFLHSLFSQVDIALNGTQITTSTNTYPYRSMIETLLTYGDDAKKTQLTSALFAKDDAGEMNSVALVGGHVNNGYLTRRTYSTGSKMFDLMGRLHADIFFQNRYLLNEVTMKIKLNRSNDRFCLMSGDRYTVKIVGAELLVRKVKLSPSVFLAHARALEYGTAKYPIKRVVCKAFTVPQGYLDVSHEKLYSGQIPARLVVTLVDNEGYNGVFARNPFNFHHFDLCEIGVYLDGQQVHAIKPLKPNFEDGLYVDAYMSLFGGTGKINRDEGNHITRSDYTSGYTLYAYDLSPDLAEDDHFNLTRQGSVRLYLKFANALPRTVTVIAYAEFENLIEIDRNRNIVYDFGV
jgi:hypothetical protein